MRKVLIPVAAAVLSATAYQAAASNGTVTFNGEIVQSTCQVSTGDQDKTVELGKYPTTAFPKAESTSASKAFTISLEKCEAGDYTLRFDGNTVSGRPDLLSVTGGATGVGIEILDNNGNHFPIANDPTDLAYVTVSGDGDAAGTATFNLQARYHSFQDAVTPGQANATSQFTIQYK